MARIELTTRIAAPLGVLGRVAERLFLRAYLQRLLERRNREIKAVAESDSWKQFVPGNITDRRLP